MLKKYKNINSEPFEKEANKKEQTPQMIDFSAHLEEINFVSTWKHI